MAKLHSPLAPVRLLRPDVPARIEEVLTRASAMHPDDRYPTVAEFVASWQTAVVRQPDDDHRTAGDYRPTSGRGNGSARRH